MPSRYSEAVSAESVVLIGMPGVVTAEVVGPLTDAVASGSIAGRTAVEVVDSSSLTDPQARDRWRRGAVVWLDDGSATAEARARALRDLTTAADLIVDVDGLSSEAVVELVVGGLTRPAVVGRERILTETVAFDDGRSYPIHIGRGASRRLADVVPDRAERVAVITQPGIGVEVDSGREQRTFLLDPGEESKQLATVGELASAMARWGMTRADAVVSVGGGVVSDVAGFVAATYHRGVPVVHVSTTLLGQIDAAIGGKTGVNLPEGKNLVGAFWQPTAVICEIDALETLPDREFVSGMGELAKYHFIGGGHLDRLPLVDRVAASARIKADVVSGDEREGGRRAILNYGHTLAHALETAGSYDLRHGEAVGIGLVYAAELAHRLGRIGRARVDEHRRVVAHYGLGTDLPAGYDLDELVMLFRRDKKALDGTTFVLDGPGGVEPVLVDDDELLTAVLRTMAARHG